ncbi:MAG: DUF3857 domain-containing protein [Planctomycetota bacterium]|jgi:tetratricopeptide (TPR) repeat protein
MSKKSRSVSIPLLLLLISGLSHAQALPQAESKALEQKAQGRYAQALASFVELMRGCREGESDAALAEYYAVYAGLLAGRIGDQATLEFFEEQATSELAKAWPQYRDRLWQLSREAAARTGDLARVDKFARELGALRRFWVLGPFDNERGSGHARELAAEKHFDLQASYQGKKQSVSWRLMNQDAGLSRSIPLASMLRPQQQVLAYAAVALMSEQAQEVVLHLGSSESYKVFLNGREEASSDLVRGFAADQDLVPLRLQAGANLLLLKIGCQEGSFEFAARIRDRSGRPCPGVTESLSATDMAAAAEARSAGAAAAIGDPGARGYFALSAAETGNLADKYRLAFLLALDRVENPQDRRDRALLQDVVSAAPEFSAARYLLAFTRIRSNARAEERDENQRRQDYLAILEANPRHVEAMRSLAELELEMNGARARAESLLEGSLAVNPGFTLGRLLLANLYRRSELRILGEEAIEIAAKRDGAGRRSSLAMQAWLEVLISRRSWQEARELSRDMLAVDYAGSLADAVELHMRLGETAEAVELLEEAMLRLPYRRYPYLRLAEVQAAGSDRTAALSTLGRWLEICPDDDTVLTQVAHLHGLLGNDDQRIQFLRTAIELNPNLKTEQRLLEFLEADELPFYAEHSRSYTDIVAADPGPPEDAAAANDPYYYLSSQVVIQAYKNGTTSRYQHQILQVLNAEGAQARSEYYVPHFRGEQRARLLLARVHKSDGRLLSPRMRGGYVRFPPLEKGDRIEIQSRVDDLAPSFFGDYFGLRHRFASPEGVPLRRSELTLILDPGRNYRIQTSNLEVEGSRTENPAGQILHQYLLEDLPRLSVEMRRPSWTETEPLLRVTTYRDWNEFCTWWWNLIREQSEVSTDIRAKTAELTAGLSSTREKIDAIYRFVTTDIRYKAWEFGVHGYQPYSTSVIFDRRHGDCKDKSILLNAMLGEIGVEAFPVLIYADPLRSEDDLNLPMVEHFNHCISYLPAAGDRPELYLDGTASYHPSDSLPEMDRGARVLVVRGEEGEVRQIDWGRPEDNVSAIEYEIQLDRDGVALIDYSQQPSGTQAIGLRVLLSNEAGQRRENLEQLLFRVFGDLEILAMESSDALDLDEELSLSLRMRCPDFAAREGNGLALKSRLTGTAMQSLTSDRSRQEALLLGPPSSSQERARYRLPTGYAPLDLPPAIELDTRFGSFYLAWDHADGILSVERRLSWKLPRIESEEYAEFREYASKVDAADQQIVVVGPGGRP